MKNALNRRSWLVALCIVIAICLLGIAIIQFNLLSDRNSITSAPTPTPFPLPLFPWPPPDPSGKEVLTLGSLGQLAETGVPFHEIDERIYMALVAAGYDDRSYYAVPEGFAIVTQLEKIDANGYPEYSDRWTSSLEPMRLADFSLKRYLDALFSVPQGYYRVFVFIITSASVSPSGSGVAQGEAKLWATRGANILPVQMENILYTREYSTTAYIYEFVQSGIGSDANQNLPSKLSGQEHLERAGLLENLNADCPSEHDPSMITYGSTISGTICPSLDWDEYHFLGTAGDKIRIRVKPNIPIPLCIHLTKPGNTVSIVCDNEVVATLDLTGEYVISTENKSGTEIYNYTLELERLP